MDTRPTAAISTATTSGHKGGYRSTGAENLRAAAAAAAAAAATVVVPVPSLVFLAADPAQSLPLPFRVGVRIDVPGSLLWDNCVWLGDGCMCVVGRWMHVGQFEQPCWLDSLEAGWKRLRLVRVQAGGLPPTAAFNWNRLGLVRVPAGAVALLPLLRFPAVGRVPLLPSILQPPGLLDKVGAQWFRGSGCSVVAWPCCGCSVVSLQLRAARLRFLAIAQCICLVRCMLH